MSRNGVCDRCGGRGTIWTGAERINCPAPNCDDGRVVIRGVPDPVRLAPAARNDGIPVPSTGLPEASDTTGSGSGASHSLTTDAGSRAGSKGSSGSRTERSGSSAYRVTVQLPAEGGSQRGRAPSQAPTLRPRQAAGRP